MYFLRQSQLLANLVVITAIWMTTSFNYYLIQFQLKYFPGDVYVNGMIFSVCSIVALVASGYLYMKLGPKICFSACLLMMAITGYIILFFGYSAKSPLVFPALVLSASFGAASCFNLVYIAHTSIFPALFAATAMGICNFFARLATMMAPLVAEMEGKTAMVIFTILSSVTFLLSLGL